MRGLFAYEHETRIDADGVQRWFVVEQKRRFELAPYFDHWQTAAEIAGKMTRGDEFCDKIPAMPYGAPVPRNHAHAYFPDASGKPPARKIPK